MLEQETLMKHSKLQSERVEFVKKPNLPDGKAAVVAINARAGEAINKLTSMGIHCIGIDADNRLPAPVRNHADMQLLHIGRNGIFCQKEHLFIGEFENFFKTQEIAKECSNIYPEDVLLNCTIIGDKIICNPKTVAKEILEFAERCNLTVISVNQGYARCSVCVINEKAIITDDESIYRAAGKFLNDVLLVSKNSIGLKGYNYGFIGGCSGKIDKDKIAFNGEIECHSDSKAIIDFLNKYKIKPVELKKGRLEDIGGILPLIQYI